MAEAKDTYGKVFKQASAVLMARVVGNDAAAIVQADIASAEYTIYELDDADPDAQTAVAGHTGVSLVVADVVFNGLQTDFWTVDGTGYNFRLIPDVSGNQAFAEAGKRYGVEVRLTPVEGQVIVLRFRCNVI